MSCPSISSYEGVALRFAQPEPQRLEGGNQIDFPVASADRVPIGQHDALVFAEQVSPPGVTVDQPGRELKAGRAISGLELLARVRSQPRLSSSKCPGLA